MALKTLREKGGEKDAKPTISGAGAGLDGDAGDHSAKLPGSAAEVGSSMDASEAA
jgi:hypothetical protein